MMTICLPLLTLQFASSLSSCCFNFQCLSQYLREQVYYGWLCKETLQTIKFCSCSNSSGSSSLRLPVPMLKLAQSGSSQVASLGP